MARVSTYDTIEYRSGEVGRKSAPSRLSTRASGIRASDRFAWSSARTARRASGKPRVRPTGTSIGAPPTYQPTESVHRDFTRVWTVSYTHL